MARGKRRRQTKPSSAPDDDRPDVLEKADMWNERFSKYYKAQNIIPEEEWDKFMDRLREPLPTTFRVAGSREIAHSLNSTIETNYVSQLTGATFEGETVPPPAKIPWYPDGLAWQFNVSKKVLRKQPEFRKFHSFLVYETEVGNISRQEAVSMIPPLLLDVEPHHKVIDMCAAPGSKTAQLLEALHARDTATATSTPPGLLIANDSESKRAHLLIHQSARLPSPAFMVTNLDASIYPIMRLPNSTSTTRGKVKNQLLFDRILCDVPCSGDGTLRKNIGIWKKWQPMDGNGLHGLQIRILQRAMRMLEDDGRIVYSTCSLNPVENEAVIAAALNSNPEFELIDVYDRLQELVRRPGIATWKPTVDRNIDTSFATWADYVASLEGKQPAAKMAETHWPPANAEELGLPKCLRIYPHLQDTGGFFVAVLQKKGTSKASAGTSERKRPADEVADANPENDAKKAKFDGEGEDDATAADVTMLDSSEQTNADGDAAAQPAAPSKSNTTAQPRKVFDTGFRESPYTFLSPDDPAIKQCMEQLFLDPSFPSSNVLVRSPSGETVRSLYLTNDIVHAVVAANDYTRIRLLTCGTKAITRQEASKGIAAQFRILGEGLPVVLPYTRPDTILEADAAALKILLSVYYPLSSSFGEPFRSAVDARETGSHIVRFPASSEINLTHDLLVPLWKSNVSISMMIDKKAKSALSLRLFGEDITVAAREAAQKNRGARGNVPAAAEPAPEVTAEQAEVEPDGEEQTNADDDTIIDDTINDEHSKQNS
ncbi:S-adenosyl-L-methionine-dependent methyltransferase [Coniophora puteana RWD-64-598 SS2]|uniref:S-adenosyl-L-methionine-dependent methyltransferase n=1 Tax=Coniophora puteana (strain RWD-64-598) TaxID=741705 RepID=A0A5M3MEY3_CONPW|nr:S-adenosyl-L-methionine-dependent methyltransferase [Coniophora puteana RWD-64-598 SS2]EIW77165.1 S-adenosyl-L-methionine-dependent methyltransferase [Coniophora puteana RWD-64-598 SS2]